MITTEQEKSALARCDSLRKRAFCLRWLSRHTFRDSRTGRLNHPTVPKASVELAQRILNQNPL